VRRSCVHRRALATSACFVPHSLRYCECDSRWCTGGNCLAVDGSKDEELCKALPEQDADIEPFVACVGEGIRPDSGGGHGATVSALHAPLVGALLVDTSGISLSFRTVSPIKSQSRKPQVPRRPPRKRRPRWTSRSARSTPPRRFRSAMPVAPETRERLACGASTQCGSWAWCSS